MFFSLSLSLSKKKEKKLRLQCFIYEYEKWCSFLFSLSSVVILRFLSVKNRHSFSFKFTVCRGLYILPIKFNLQNKLYVRMNIFTENYVNILEIKRERKVYERDRMIEKKPTSAKTNNAANTRRHFQREKDELFTGSS